MKDIDFAGLVEFSSDKTQYDDVRVVKLKISGTSSKPFAITLNDEFNPETSGNPMYLRIFCDDENNVVGSGTFSTNIRTFRSGLPCPADAKTHTFVIEVSKNKDYSEADRYVFNVSRYPVLADFIVKDGETEIAVEPAVTTDAFRTEGVHTVVTNMEKVIIKYTAQFDDIDEYNVTIGGIETWGDDELDLNQFTPDAKGNRTVKVVITGVEGGEYEGISKEFTLLFVKPVYDYLPIIEEPTETEITVEKDEPVSLTYKVEQTEDSKKANGVLSYQWQESWNGNFDWYGEPIEGATDAVYAFTAPKYTESKYYRCVVTNTVNGEKYERISTPIKVTVNLTYVSPPFIMRQLGTYQPGAPGADYEEYKTTYQAGSKFDDMRVSFKAETGVQYSAKLYYNTVNSYETALPVEAECKVGDGGGCTFIPEKGFGIPGDYYLFCEITATKTDDPTQTASIRSDIVKLTYTPHSFEWNLAGAGTEENPYLIKTAEDLAAIRHEVNDNGNRLNGIWFRFVNDITLPENWQPIGRVLRVSQGDSENADYAFSGHIDGAGHTLTVPEGGRPLLYVVSDTIIKNLNIYGERIEGCGLVDSSFLDYGEDGNYWTGCPPLGTFDNIRLLSGSRTRKSGLLDSSGSGANTAYIRNCVIEEDVIVGYAKDQYSVGSIICQLNGQIDNCVSYATVYAKRTAGGLAGVKGQSMGLCTVRNSAFLGRIESTGEAGGIIGDGYISESAPNTMPVSVINCYVAADISGQTVVGGILGDESGLKAVLNQGAIRDNIFYGSLNAPADAKVGGIIGWHGGINRNLDITNNYYYDSAGNAKAAIG